MGLAGQAARVSGGSGRAVLVTGGGIIRIWRPRNGSSMWMLASGAARCAGRRLNRPGFCGGCQSTGEWDDGSSTEVSGRAA
jgi:hypothetical protein